MRRSRAEKKLERAVARAGAEGAAADVRVRVSPVMLVMAAVFVAVGRAYEFACSLTAVILHEFAHARVAKRMGYALNEVRLMPYGAALCGAADMPPRHEIAVAAAGPAFNLVIGLIFAALWWLFPPSYPFTETFCKCNMYIGCFNLLPVYPLDGGRVAFALLAVRLDRRRAYAITRVISAAFGVGAIALFAVSAAYALNITFLTVGVFMVASAFIPDHRAGYYALFALGSRRARLERPVEKARYAVSDGARLSELVRVLHPDRVTEFDVYDAGMKMLGRLDEGGLIAAVSAIGYAATAGEALKIFIRY